MREIRCVWPDAAELGEGPIWSPPHKALWFVDIKGQQVLRFDPDTGARKGWPSPSQISFILPASNNGFIVGLPGQLAYFMPEPGAFTPIVSFESEWPWNRPNDACIDAAGRLWFGTMDDHETDPNGALYCWPGTGAPIAQDRGFIISNGPAHSPDGRFMYHTDTIRRTIYRFDTTANGSITNKQVFIKIEESAGFPDGTTIDSEGCLWVALWNGWSVRRYSPTGKLLETVTLPCANITKIAFGGDRLTTAYITTARVGLSPAELAKQNLAGSVLTFETDVPGLPTKTILVAPG